MMIVVMRWKAIVGAALQRATITMEKVMLNRAIGTSRFVCVSTPYSFTFLIFLADLFLYSHSDIEGLHNASSNDEEDGEEDENTLLRLNGRPWTEVKSLDIDPASETRFKLHA